MNAEQTLVDELRAVASSLQPPPAPVEVLVRRAERVRSRRRLAVTSGLAAAAVVAAVVVVAQPGRESSSPSPIAPSPSPSYYAPGAPYVDDGVLYIDHRAQPGTWLEAKTSDDTTVAIRDDGRRETAVVLRGSIQIYQVWEFHSAPALSPRGTLLAWIMPTEDGATLVVRDLDKGRELGRVLVGGAAPVAERSVAVDAVYEDGTTYYRASGRSWSWRPGGEPKADQTPPEPFPHPGFPGEAKAVLSPDQLWGAWLAGDPVPADDTEVYALLAVQKPGDPSSRFTLTLPDAVGTAVVSWDTPTSVAVTVPPEGRTGPGPLYLCDIVDRRCLDAEDVEGQ